MKRLNPPKPQTTVFRVETAFHATKLEADKALRRLAMERGFKPITVYIDPTGSETLSIERESLASLGYTAEELARWESLQAVLDSLNANPEETQ